MIDLKSSQLDGICKEDIKKILTAEALLKSLSYLSLIRHRLEKTIPWDTASAPSLFEVDQLLGRLEFLLNWKD